MFDPLRRSLKAQLREANKSGARFALILGDTEMEKGTVVFKDLEKGEQKNILQKKIKNLFDNLTNWILHHYIIYAGVRNPIT